MSVIDSNIRLTDLGKKIRPAAVAGLFYPDDPAELQQMVRTLLSEAKTTINAPKAIIAPHAGYIYSGAVAASAYVTLSAHRNTITRVIILGPAHRVYVEGLAIPSSNRVFDPTGHY